MSGPATADAQSIDYDALAKQAGAISSMPDYDALAKQAGAVSSTAPPSAKQPSTWDVLTQPTDKTDKEYLGYTGPAGVAGATIHGLNDVARGTVSAVKGAVNTFDPRVQPGENTLTANPLVRILRGLYGVAKQVPQIPAAVRDINQSVDPTGRYLDAAQDTASQGAGQALTAIGTEALPKAVAGAGEIVKRTVPPLVRGVARGTNALLEKAPGYVGGAAGAAVGHATHIPYGGTVGGILGAGLGKELLPRLRVPGEEFGLPKPTYPGAPLPASPPTGEFVDTPTEAQPPTAPSQVVEPKLLPATASGVSRRMPGEIAPEDVSAPDASTLGGRKGIRIVIPGPPKLLPAASATEEAVATPQAATPIVDTSRAAVGDLLNKGLGYEPPPKPVPGKPIFMRPKPVAAPAVPVPEGMTPVESSGMRAYSYDEPSQTFTAQWPDGSLHRYGEVTPKEVEAFKAADSKGRALLQIKNNHVHTGANYGNGWVNKSSAIRSATPNAASVAVSPASNASANSAPVSGDLTSLLQQSLEAATRTKGKVAQK